MRIQMLAGQVVADDQVRATTLRRRGKNLISFTHQPLLRPTAHRYSMVRSGPGYLPTSWCTSPLRTSRHDRPSRPANSNIRSSSASKSALVNRLLLTLTILTFLCLVVDQYYFGPQSKHRRSAKARYDSLPGLSPGENTSARAESDGTR